MTNQELIDDYALLSLEGLAPRTQKEYLYNLREFERFQTKQGKLLVDATARDLAEWIRIKKTKSESTTVKRKLAALKKFYSFLEIKGYLTDPSDIKFVEKMKVKLTKGKEAHRALTSEEVKICLSKITHPLFRFVFLLGLEFGICREEYTRIKLTDADLVNRRLRIHGKGDKIRFIPITNAQVERFHEYLKHRARDGIRHDYLLYSKNGNVIKRTLERYFNEICDQTGIQFTSHDLRVTFATRLWRAGCDILSISQKLGHASIQTTMGYIKPTEQEINARYLAVAEDLSLTI